MEKWEFLTPNGWIPSKTPTKETMKELKFIQSGNYWTSNSRGGGTWFFRTK